MKNICLLSMICLLLVSCSLFSSLTSTTTITPFNRFELGKNEHGSFTVQLQNMSTHAIEVYKAPLNGGKHSSQTIAPDEMITVRVEKNTGIIINNATADTATVKLKVTGDTGLSMGYGSKNQ